MITASELFVMANISCTDEILTERLSNLCDALELGFIAANSDQGNPVAGDNASRKADDVAAVADCYGLKNKQQVSPPYGGTKISACISGRDTTSSLVGYQRPGVVSARTSTFLTEGTPPVRKI